MTYPSKDIHKDTWKFPDRMYGNRTDYVLVSGLWTKSIQDVKASNREHPTTSFMISESKPWIRNKKQQHDVEKWPDPTEANDFQATGGNGRRVMKDT